MKKFLSQAKNAVPACARELALVPALLKAIKAKRPAVIDVATEMDVIAPGGGELNGGD